MFGIVGEYLVYLAYELFRDRNELDTSMSTPARFAFIALFVLSGAALFVYAFLIWKRALQEEKEKKPPEDDSSMK